MAPGPQTGAQSLDGHELRRALAFNAVGPALNEHGAWLPPTVRQAVADAVLAAVDTELQQLREQLAEARTALRIAEGDRDAAVEQAEEGQAALEMYGLWQRRAENARRKIEQVRAIPRLPHSSQQTGELGRAYTGGWESVINAIDTAVGRPQGECRRCHCPAGAPDCTHCNGCDVPDQPARDR
ncbi:hypothetical protein [Streptomyces sp. NPDC002402]